MRQLQVSVAGVAERVAEVQVVEDKLDSLRFHAAEVEVARDVRRIRVRIKRRVKRPGDWLLAAVLHPARRICAFKVIQGQKSETRNAWQNLACSPRNISVTSSSV